MSLDRRRFLQHAAFFTVVPSALVACGGGDNAEPAGRYAFPQGVASGDPKDTSLMFWGRCVRTDGSLGDVPVTLQVASSAQFTTALAQVDLTPGRCRRAGARLQALHAKWPIVATWDDHEFSDDCWQDHQTYTNENKQETARRRAANQAWVEYTPVDFGDVSFDASSTAFTNIRIYRDFHFGSVVHLVMTDERLYRDNHVVDEAAIALAQGHDLIAGRAVVEDTV